MILVSRVEPARGNGHIVAQNEHSGDFLEMMTLVDLSSWSELLVPKTIDQVIGDHVDGLHQGIQEIAVIKFYSDQSLHHISPGWHRGLSYMTTPKRLSHLFPAKSIRLETVSRVCRWLLNKRG